MINNPLVSISIPHFNYPLYLDECVDSILDQTFQNFEIIIVDDCSTDIIAREIVLKQQNKDNRIKCIFNERNMKCAESRNIGILNSNGKYIVSFDSDNTMCSNFLERHLNEINSHPIVSSNYQWFGDKNEMEIKPESCGLNILLTTNYIDCCAMFEKQLWEECGGFKSELENMFDDWEFWINLAKLGYEVYFIPEILFNYRSHKKRSTITETNLFIKHLNIIKSHHSDFNPDFVGWESICGKETP